MLGCGTHRAAIFDRCESIKVADLDDVISGEWERLLDNASQATVEVGRNGDCCRALDQIVPWRHELVIWRDDEQVWSGPLMDRSEEHTSELQSRGHLVCRLLLEKKNTQ